MRKLTLSVVSAAVLLAAVPAFAGIHYKSVTKTEAEGQKSRGSDVQAEGWAAGDDPRTVAYLAWSVVHGLAALWLGGSLEADQRPFDEIAGEVAALLGRSLAPRPAPDPAQPAPSPGAGA